MLRQKKLITPVGPGPTMQTGNQGNNTRIASAPFGQAAQISFCQPGDGDSDADTDVVAVARLMLLRVLAGALVAWHWQLLLWRVSSASTSASWPGVFGKTCICLHSPKSEEGEKEAEMLYSDVDLHLQTHNGHAEDNSSKKEQNIMIVIKTITARAGAGLGSRGAFPPLRACDKQ